MVRSTGSSFVSIVPLTLRPNKPLGANLYVCANSFEKPTLLLANQEYLTHDAHQRILENPVKYYVTQDEWENYQSYLREALPTLIDNDSLGPLGQTAVLAEIVRDSIKKQFATRDTMTIVAGASRIAHQVAKLLLCSQWSGAELWQLLHKDTGSFTHATNVAFYCGMIGKKFGFSQSELSDMVIGALIHNLGILEIDESTLLKNGKLNQNELRDIRLHPLVGFRRLAATDRCTTTQLLMTYQHHERLDGTGYPVGIGEDEIELTSRICSVADVYTALTSDRPQRPAYTPSKALDIMHRDVGKAFDPEVFRCFLTILIDP